MDQKFFAQPFANAGDKTEVPDDLQPSGSVSFNQGYGFDYQRELGVDPLAKPIEREAMNYVLFAITENLAQYQRNGIPEFITTAQNGGSPYSYSAGTIVRYRALPADPFVAWVSLVDANTATPGADATKWQQFRYALSSNAQALAGADNTSLMTPLRVAEAIAATPPPTVGNATESAPGIAEIATTAEAQALTDDARFVTPLKLGQAIPAASTVAVGRSRFSTTVEAQTGTAVDIGVTPAGLKAVADTKLSVSGGGLSGGINFENGLGANAQDNSRHISLNGTTWGFNVFGSALNSNVAAGGAHVTWVASQELTRVSNTVFTYKGSTVWHAANFNPADKANTVGPTFTGGIGIDVAPSGYTLFSSGVFTGNRRILAFTNTSTNIDSLAGLQMTGNDSLVSLQAFSSTYTAVASLAGRAELANTGGGMTYSAINATGNHRWTTGTARTQRMELTTAGQLNVTGAVVPNGGFQNGSSRELKFIDGPIPYGLADILKLRPVIGRYKPEFAPGDEGRSRLFLVAEDLAEVMPEPVFAEAVNSVADDPDSRKVSAVDYVQLIPALVQAFHDQNEEVRTLREQLAALSERLSNLGVGHA